MDIGLGLPCAIPGTDGRRLLEFAAEGERAGFSTLATLDRLVYDTYESLATLAAVAGATERIRLMTAIAVAPLRANTALLAKQIATVDRLSQGRFVFGAAVGAQPDEFDASGVEFAGRGPRLTTQLERMRRIWSGADDGDAIGPRPTREYGPELILGGSAPAALARAARLADGWVSGCGVDSFLSLAGQVRAAWQKAGRAERPRMIAQVYYALGPGAAARAENYLKEYYGFASSFAEFVVDGALTSAEDIRSATRRLHEAGCDEVLLFPCSADLDQIALLQDALQAEDLDGMPVH